MIVGRQVIGGSVINGETLVGDIGIAKRFNNKF